MGQIGTPYAKRNEQQKPHNVPDSCLAVVAGAAFPVPLNNRNGGCDNVGFRITRAFGVDKQIVLFF